MAVDALKIVEGQLKYLEERGSKALLTADETVQLSNLVKVRILLKSKALANDSDDDLDSLSTDDLKGLLEVLK